MCRTYPPYNEVEKDGVCVKKNYVPPTDKYDTLKGVLTITIVGFSILGMVYYLTKPTS